MNGNAKQRFLTQWQRAILEQCSRRSSASQRLVVRARLLLAYDDGEKKVAIARRHGVHVKRVWRWIKRFTQAKPALLEAEEAYRAESGGKMPKAYAEDVLAVLDDACRSGRPPVFTAVQATAVIALACEVRDDSEEPTSHWTYEELATEAARRRLVPKISDITVWRFLKSGRYQAAS